jgi:hypothetical protein
MRQSQLNVRLSREALDALEAAVFVRSLRSAQELIGPVVEDFAQQLMADDDVVSAIKLREGRRGLTNVTSMRPTKSPPKRSASTRKSSS